MANSLGNNMMLVNSVFRNARSFSLIPVSVDSPYVEAMFDPSSGILAVIGKEKKDSFHMLPRLNDDGQPIRLKVPNQQTGKTVKEHRVNINTFQEYYINDKEDIKTFVELFAVNASSFKYKEFLEVDLNETKTSNIILPGQ
jgi:Na+-transporting NADH:ubiquinone oxidoreductase subunit NqrC